MLKTIFNIRIIIFCVMAMLLAEYSFAQKDNNLLEKKAYYIKNFSIFTTWPDTLVEESGQTVFTIYIIGDTPMEKCLKEYYVDKQIKDQRVNVVKINTINEIQNCHLLFISESKRDELSEILEYTKNLPILTLSDSTGFADLGVLINFIEVQGRLSFEINEKALRNSGLYISHLLLKEAKIINPVNK